MPGCDRLYREYKEQKKAEVNAWLHESLLMIIGFIIVIFLYCWSQAL